MLLLVLLFVFAIAVGLYFWLNNDKNNTTEPPTEDPFDGTEDPETDQPEISLSTSNRPETASSRISNVEPTLSGLQSWVRSHAPVESGLGALNNLCRGEENRTSCALSCDPTLSSYTNPITVVQTEHHWALSNGEPLSKASWTASCNK